MQYYPAHLRPEPRVGWQTANVGTQRVVIEHALRADKITRITAVVDYNPGGGDFQQAIVYVPDYGSTSNSATRLVSAPTTGNGLNLTWPASGLGSRADLTVLQVNIWAGTSGSAVIRSMTIEGEGYFEGQCSQPTATPTPTATFTPTATLTSTTTPTPIVTPTVVPTLVPTPTGGCTLTILYTSANIRRGPSADDFLVATASQGSQFVAVATAVDEDSQTWYGLYHAQRPQYISWVVKTSGVDVSQVTGAGCASLPQLNTPTDSAPWQSVLGTPTLPLRPSALATSLFRGFGITDAQQYSSIGKCQHPGFDFPASALIPVYAIADGYVVGIGANGALDRPAQWGATDGGFNLVVRTSGHFVLYGHLAAVDESLYYGKQVKAGDILGTLADQQGNTHLHVEVSAFGNNQQVSNDNLRKRFGAIRRGGTQNPTHVIDLMLYVPAAVRGGNPIPATAIQNCTQPTATYAYTTYNGATLHNGYGDGVFNYRSKDDVALQCFAMQTGNRVSSPSVCVSLKPE